MSIASHKPTQRQPKRLTKGFTLIELVVTLSISTIVVSFAAMFISAPIQGFIDQSRRVRLVDAADSALSRMSRDVRRALPNTVRTRTSGAIIALEMISTLDGARYREQPPGTTDQILDFTTADTSFNVIGAFTEISKPFSSTSHYLVIYNVGVPGANAYELSNVITPPGTQINIAADTVAGEDRITLSPAFRFSYGSPVQRVFLVDGPISYLCDSAAGTLTRYSSYSIAGNHADRDSHGELVAAGANFGLIADRLASCTFNYAPGSAERAGMLSMNVRVSEQGETVALLAQVHVDNVP